MPSTTQDEKRVLLICSLTEFGERYAYYFLQSLLILFLVVHFSLPEKQSASLVGTVLAMVYISAIVGGIIADHWLGHYYAAFCGALLMLTGSSCIALTSSLLGLSVGLAFIAMSTGLIKVNMSSLIGHFYDKAGLPESRRDFGFSLFYVGINLGSFFSLLIASFLADRFGYNTAFLSSVCVNGFMLCVLISGLFLIKDFSREVQLTKLNCMKSFITMMLYMGVVLAVLQFPLLADFSTLAAALLCLGILVSAAKGHHTKGPIFAAAMFLMLSIIYWSLYFQQFISIELFVKKGVNHELLGFTLSTTQFLAFNSIAILTLGYVFGKLWMWLDHKGWYLHDIDKFLLAFLLIAANFFFFYLTIVSTEEGQQVNALWAALFFFLLAPSELCLSAIGLSAITKIAPEGKVALFMSMWLVTLGIGGKLAGILSTYLPMGNTLAEHKSVMTNGLLIFIAIALVTVCVAFIMRVPMKRWTV